LKDEFGLAARVIDIRWLNPLPFEAIRRHADECGRLLAADECRATGGGIAEVVIATLAENGFKARGAQCERRFLCASRRRREPRSDI